MLLISESTNEQLIGNYHIYNFFNNNFFNTHRTIGTNVLFRKYELIMLFIRGQPTNN